MRKVIRICCQQGDITDAVEKFIAEDRRKRGYEIVDRVSLFGDVALLLPSSPQFSRETLLRAIEISFTKHHADGCLMFGHTQCQFRTDFGVDGRKNVVRQLSYAKCTLSAMFSGIPVQYERYIIDKDPKPELLLISM